MNSKLIIILASVLIVISGFGIFLTKGEKTTQAKNQHNITSKVFVLAKDIKKGQIISANDIKMEEKSFNLTEVQDSYIINKPLAYVKDCIATTDLKAQMILKYEYISRNGISYEENLVLDELSNSNDLPFDFTLSNREFGIVKYMKKGELADIYFRYEIKNKESESPIIARSKDNSSKENGNLTNMILLFKDKKVLDIRTDLAPKSPQDSKSINLGGTLVLQMNSDEIRSIYAIENLGRFYIFPAKEQQNSSSGISTQEVLAQDFIKELRGGTK